MEMQRARLADLSFLFNTKKILHDNKMNTIAEGYQVDLYRTEVPYYINVTDDYPQVLKEGVYLPSVVITQSSISEAGLQIGGGFWNYRYFDVDIFARRDGERDDILNVIYEGLDKSATVKNYNLAFPEYVYSPSGGILVEHYSGVVPDAISDLEVLSKTVDYIPRTSPREVDSHRAVITVRTYDIR